MENVEHGINNGLKRTANGYYVTDTGDPDRAAITKRFEELGIDDVYLAVANYDWSNWTDHYNWCMTASKDELKDWADSILRDIPCDEDDE